MMIDLQELQILAQLIDSMEISIGKLEKAYDKNDAEGFVKSKNEIVTFHKRISDIVK